MVRFALILAAIVVFGLVIRNALLGAMREGKPGQKRRSSPNLPPDRLVCGVCGESFDPEASGWICPSCKK